MIMALSIIVVSCGHKENVCCDKIKGAIELWRCFWLGWGAKFSAILQGTVIVNCSQMVFYQGRHANNLRYTMADIVDVYTFL